LALTPGTRLGVYEVTAQIGEGGMGEVYKGRDTRLDRTVAIKVEVTNTPIALSDEVLTLEEAAALLKLPADTVRSRAEEGDLPGRRFGKEWRFARKAVLAWLADGDPQKRRHTS
jgi:excisionase family DNA binding protein